MVSCPPWGDPSRNFGGLGVPVLPTLPLVATGWVLAPRNLQIDPAADATFGSSDTIYDGWRCVSIAPVSRVEGNGPGWLLMVNIHPITTTRPRMFPGATEVIGHLPGR